MPDPLKFGVDLEAARQGHQQLRRFDDKLIDIIKKYGLAALIGGGISNFTPTAKPQKKPST